MKRIALALSLVSGCYRPQNVRPPMGPDEAAAEARSECEAFAKQSAGFDVDKCVQERAPARTRAPSGA